MKNNADGEKELLPHRRNAAVLQKLHVFKKA